MSLPVSVRNGILIAAVATFLSGCMTQNAYTGEKQVSKTTKGAGIGALAGAAVGALTGDNSKERRKRALIGAGVGRTRRRCCRQLHGSPGSQAARAAPGQRCLGEPQWREHRAQHARQYHVRHGQLGPQLELLQRARLGRARPEGIRQDRDRRGRSYRTASARSPPIKLFQSAGPQRSASTSSRRASPISAWRRSGMARRIRLRRTTRRTVASRTAA